MPVAVLLPCLGLVIVTFGACLDEGLRPVTDGQFTFTVKEVECGVPSLGSGLLTNVARGEFCIVSMVVENTGDEVRSMDSGNQYLIAGGRKYAPAPALLAGAENFWMKEIEPGDAVEGRIAFDVPQGVEPERLELHDAPRSVGVTLEIS